MSSSLQSANSNSLLARLGGADREWLSQISEEVTLEHGRTLWEAGSAMPHVYFPLSGFLSSVIPMEDGTPEVETVCTGLEGMVGATLLLGVTYSTERVLVQGAGRAIRASAAEFRRELARNEAMRSLLQLYLFVLTTQLAQNIACSQHHLLEQRFARWLLMAQDRMQAPEFLLTQEFMANMLGVHRPAVSEAVRLMSKRGLISHSRGQIRVVNREALESAACPCYASQRAIYERFLGKPLSR
jgi:CRP-like cAMP-binding protein